MNLSSLCQGNLLTSFISRNEFSIQRVDESKKLDFIKIFVNVYIINVDRLSETISLPFKSRNKVCVYTTLPDFTCEITPSILLLLLCIYILNVSSLFVAWQA